MSIVKFIKNETKLLSHKEIILYGGSFNPWHDGHESCLALAPKNIPVIIVPDHNPYKELNIQAEADKVIIDLKELLQSNERELFFYDGFFKLNKKNPSHQWIEALKKSYPKKEFSLLMGFDSFMGIDRWIEAKSVLNNITALYVASRLDDLTLKEKQLINLLSINSKLKIVFLGRHDHEHVSSTEIRKKEL